MMGGGAALAISFGAAAVVNLGLYFLRVYWDYKHPTQHSKGREWRFF